MRKFECKTCGAELFYNNKSKSLKCKYCESEFSPSDFDDDDSQNMAELKVERETEINDTPTDQSETNVPLVVYKCANCGAEIVTAKSTLATTCVYCNRALSLTGKMVGDFKPDLIIPFVVSQEQAIKIYEKYAQSTFLTPKHFRKKSEIKKIKGLYVPFWLNSFVDETSAMIECENSHNERKGDDLIVNHHKYHVFIDLVGKFIRMPVVALKYLDPKIIMAIEPYNYKKLLPFTPAYMAGYYAEAYSLSKKKAATSAQTRATEEMANVSLNEAGIFMSKSVSYIDDNCGKMTTEYAMLPAWIFNTEYKNKKYTFVINGQTGDIAGKLPISISKLLCTLGITFMAVQTLSLVMYYVINALVS